jgi:bifunctional DNA-binding transcriptional regulator/antitoxin component of YhaV-PrlF toxin-antitoxin module
MKSALRVGRRGAVTLLAKLREALDIKTGDHLIAEATLEGLLLRPAVTLPIEIYSDKRIREFDEAEAELEKVMRRKKRLRSGR